MITLKFKECLDKTDEILYVGDNAGEICFLYRILIEEFKKASDICCER